MSQVLLRHQLGLLYTKEEKSLRIGHKTHKGGLQAFRPGAIWTIFSPSAVNQSPYWWLCHIQCWALPISQRILDTLGEVCFCPPGDNRHGHSSEVCVPTYGTFYPHMADSGWKDGFGCLSVV